MLAVIILNSTSHGAVVKLKLSDVNAGSESVSLVTNGDFEDTSSGNTHTPSGWSRNGDMFYDYDNSVNIPSMGTHTAKVHMDNAGNATGRYEQSVTLTANTEYVLSAYIFHLGDGTHGGTAELDLNDMLGEPDDGGGSISISQADDSANGGYFVYGTFNSGANTSATVRAFMVTAGVPDTGWPQDPVGALWDNIAITEAGSFVAPTQVPEPGAVSLLSLAGIAFILRRRK